MKEIEQAYQDTILVVLHAIWYTWHVSKWTWPSIEMKETAHSLVYIDSFIMVVYWIDLGHGSGMFVMFYFCLICYHVSWENSHAKA